MSNKDKEQESNNMVWGVLIGFLAGLVILTAIGMVFLSNDKPDNTQKQPIHRSIFRF